MDNFFCFFVIKWGDVVIWVSGLVLVVVVVVVLFFFGCDVW